ncbi:amidase [Microdochium nivale]|nr:amidase [Microdochium nivale]
MDSDGRTHEGKGQAAAVRTTTVISVSNAEYLVETDAVAGSVDLGLARHAGGLFAEGDDGQYIPATMISREDLVQVTGGARVTEELTGDQRLEEVLAKYRAQDGDVWTEEFGAVILVDHGTHFGSDGSPGEFSSKHRVVYCDIASNGAFHSGPYAVNGGTGKVYPVRRLFPDVNNCFVRGAVEAKCKGNGSVEEFRWLSTSDHIAVPSRLQYPVTSPRKPLSGLRFGVKDIIDIAGLETGCGSADYRKFHPPRTETAACIRQLIEAGAVMVGKMRCCQWCDGQDPLERLEESTPTNPRGDRFQKPSGSSSGSAAGAAGYPWLDFTIGTDTGGSIRHPAGVNGLYGVRPSCGSVTSSGLVCSALTDTTGVFARSAKIARDAMLAMMDPQWCAKNALKSEQPPFQKTKFRLLYLVSSSGEQQQQTTNTTPRFFSPGGSGPEAITPAGKQLESFVNALETLLGCKREEICIAELWKQSHPAELPADLAKATGKIYQDVVYHELARDTVEPFIRAFGQKHGGRRPYIEPTTRARLEYGRDVTVREYDESVRTLGLFGEWVSTHLLPSSPPPGSQEEEDRQGQTIPLLVYPQSWGVPRYRDEVARRGPGESIFWSGFSTYGISYCSGCPDFTLPVGEVEFRSRVTGTVEKLPVAVSLLGPRGGDRVMLDIIVQMEAGGALPSVEAGPSLFGSPLPSN